MIEKKFVQQKIKEFMIQEYITDKLNNVGHSNTQLKRTPLGEKIIITAARPGFVVGRKGENIKLITEALKKDFNLENPQIEISEVNDINLDAQVVAERIASTLERFGTQRFKGIGHRVMEDVMRSGAFGIEILISGKIPGSRAKRWRFYQGYLKKCGDIALTGVREAKVVAKLKTGIIGIQVKIMPPDVELPDKITIKTSDEITKSIEELPPKEEKEDQKQKKSAPKRPAQKKKTAKKAASKKKRSSDKEK